MCCVFQAGLKRRSAHLSLRIYLISICFKSKQQRMEPAKGLCYSESAAKHHKDQTHHSGEVKTQRRCVHTGRAAASVSDDLRGVSLNAKSLRYVWIRCIIWFQHTHIISIFCSYKEALSNTKINRQERESPAVLTHRHDVTHTLIHSDS